MTETFEGFQHRMHCSQTSPDQIERYYYDAQTELDQLRTDNEKLQNEADKLNIFLESLVASSTTGLHMNDQTQIMIKLYLNKSKNK